MNRTEVAQLLTVVSGFDRRQVDEITVNAWHAIPEVAEADARDARLTVLEHFANIAEYFTVQHLVAGIRRHRRSSATAVEADVRVARAMRLVPADWPDRQPLPADAAAALTEARAVRAAQIAEVAARPPGTHSLPELVTKRVPA